MNPYIRKGQMNIRNYGYPYKQNAKWGITWRPINLKQNIQYTDQFNSSNVISFEANNSSIFPDNLVRVFDSVFSVMNEKNHIWYSQQIWIILLDRKLCEIIHVFFLYVSSIWYSAWNTVDNKYLSSEWINIFLAMF